MGTSSTAQNPLTAWLGQDYHAIWVIEVVIIILLIVWRVRRRNRGKSK